MHYCTLLITKKLPTDDEIKKDMEPFNEFREPDGVEYPTFEFDWYEIGGRYSRLIKLSTENNDKYKWKDYAKEPRNRRLFISTILDEFKEKRFTHEERLMLSLGSRDGYIYVDGAWIEDILNLDEIRGYNLVLPDGTACTREWWNGHDFIPQEGYDDKVKKAFEIYKDCFLTVIDIHD